MTNGKVSHRKLGEVTADLHETVNQHAVVINNQGEKLRAYGERLADALAWKEEAEHRATVLAQALDSLKPDYCVMHDVTGPCLECWANPLRERLVHLERETSSLRGWFGNLQSRGFIGRLYWLVTGN